MAGIISSNGIGKLFLELAKDMTKLELQKLIEKRPSSIAGFTDSMTIRDLPSAFFTITHLAFTDT